MVFGRSVFRGGGVSGAVEAGIQLNGGAGALSANDTAEAPAGEFGVSGSWEVEFAGDLIAGAGGGLGAEVEENARSADIDCGGGNGSGCSAGVDGGHGLDGVARGAAAVGGMS